MARTLLSATGRCRIYCRSLRQRGLSEADARCVERWPAVEIGINSAGFLVGWFRHSGSHRCLQIGPQESMEVSAWYASGLWNSNVRETLPVPLELCLGSAAQVCRASSLAAAHRPMADEAGLARFDLRPLAGSAATMRAARPRINSCSIIRRPCWVGVVPFHMSGIRRARLPPLPGFSRFPELNVRTYVTYGGKPGVYFFSLDAANLPAVWAARRFYHLPYFHAAHVIARNWTETFITCRSARAPAEFRGHYRPIAPSPASRTRNIRTLG